MIFLVDTHALIWWFNEPKKLSKKAVSLLSASANTVLVSAAVAWEIAIKVNIGKLDAYSLISDFAQQIKREGFDDLPINLEQAIKAGFLTMHHRDPFDRLLIAQAEALNAPILSADTLLDPYGIKRLW